MGRELGQHDVFYFTCRMCGGCCRDDREIILNPMDVFHLSRRYQMTTTEFVRTYCVCERSDVFNGFPLLMLRTEGGVCVYLDGDLCRVHDTRPACCRNYPAGSSFTREGGVRHELMDPAPACRGFENGGAHTMEAWWVDAGLSALGPGVALMREAARAASLRLSEAEQQQLYRILCDFDALPGLPEAPDADAAMALLNEYLKKLFERF